MSSMQGGYATRPILCRLRRTTEQLNSTGYFSPTYMLVALNVAAFVIDLPFPLYSRPLLRWGMLQADLMHNPNQWYRLVAHTCLHVNGLHLIVRIKFLNESSDRSPPSPTNSRS